MCCGSTACTFDGPDDGADVARREIRLIPAAGQSRRQASRPDHAGERQRLTNAGSSPGPRHAVNVGDRDRFS
jgi:hypothetical protein